MIAQSGACCIHVGLRKEFGIPPQVRFSVSLGKHYLEGPFYGPADIALKVMEIQPEVQLYQDWLATMVELWPPPPGTFDE